MARYPEVQLKAQRELDVVLGADCLPDFSDSDSLPYLNALVKEVLRWHPVTPVGLPHCAAADDEFEGFFIPKGSILLANIWYAHTYYLMCAVYLNWSTSYRRFSRDPEIFRDPENFIPDRFLDERGQLDISHNDPAELMFGFGRR